MKVISPGVFWELKDTHGVNPVELKTEWITMKETKRRN